jgi:hypothetical protein
MAIVHEGETVSNVSSKGRITMVRSPFQRNLATIVLIVATLTAMTWASASTQEPSGPLMVDEYQLAYIFNGNVGGGKLYFQGNVYDCKIGGVGSGGVGASHIMATGEVYNLTDVSQFPGPYVQGSMGITVTDMGHGHLWLQNKNGVVLRVRTPPNGSGFGVLSGLPTR